MIQITKQAQYHLHAGSISKAKQHNADYTLFMLISTYCPYLPVKNPPNLSHLCAFPSLIDV